MKPVKPVFLPPLAERLRLVLREDLGSEGDLTSRALIPWSRRAEGELLVKADGVLSGVRLLPMVFRIAAEEVAGIEKRCVPGIRTTFYKKDGARVRPGDVAACIRGPAQVLLAGERTALNLICHLSGIATATWRFVERIRGTQARILDTRKTTPLWRDLEKKAVRDGGGENHRFGLNDMILIKDNHLALWGVNDPAAAVREAGRRFPRVKIEVEVTSLSAFQCVCQESKPDFVLLDNFAPKEVSRAVNWLRTRRIKRKTPLLEASGGIQLHNVRAYARAGVNRISIGALTHSSPALDLSLEVRA